MPVLHRRDPGQGGKIGLVVGLAIGSLAILILVYLVCSQMLALSHRKKGHGPESPGNSDMGGVRVHYENGHAHLHVHEKPKKKKKHRTNKSNHKHRSRGHGATAHMCGPDSGTVTPAPDVPEVINVSGDGPDTQLPGLVVEDLSGFEQQPAVCASEPIVVVDGAVPGAAVPIVREERHSRSGKRKTKDPDCCGLFVDKAKSKKHETRVVVAREPLYQEIVPGV